MLYFFLFWLILSIFLLFFELGTPGLFFFLSFSFGAIFAALISLFYESIYIQSLVFVGGTIISLLLLKSWTKYKSKHHKVHLTNIYALYGKKGIVEEKISKNSVGQIKVSGQIWSAKSIDDSEIIEGSQVEVIDIRGVTLFVRKV